MPKKKYFFERGDLIKDSSLHYIKDLPYSHNHRIVLVRCAACSTIKPMRLDNIISGRVRTCGCYHNEMVEDGTLTSLSVRSRKNKPWLQKGGWHYKEGGVILYIPPRYFAVCKNITLGDLFENS